MTAIDRTSPITLNFRFTLADGSEVLSTFDSGPASLSLGEGKFGSAIEDRLIGLEAGAQASFELAAGEAFGPHYAELVETIDRRELPAETALEPGSVLTFTAPDGGSFSGQLVEVRDDAVVLDFNHPLAGKPVTFEVHVIGIL